MTTWTGLVTYISNNYKVMNQTDKMIQMGFNLDELRTQTVYLWHLQLMDGQEDWVQIESPFARVDSTDVGAALKMVENNVCGGLGIAGEFLTIRHAAPLANLDLNELERPLQLVLNTADVLENQFSGQDLF